MDSNSAQSLNISSEYLQPFFTANLYDNTLLECVVRIRWGNVASSVSVTCLKCCKSSSHGHPTLLQQ